MENEFCFCGSGKPHADCHDHIHEKSFVAGLYRLQRELDEEIEKQTRDKNLDLPCGTGCGECCSRCFCVSETEFAQIFDAMARHWPKDEIADVFKKSEEQWTMLKTQVPSVAQKLRGPVTLKELFGLDQIELPFPCIFLDENSRCRIYELRPLICRVYGVAYSHFLFYKKPCSRIPAVYSNADEFVDLTKYEEKIDHYIFLKYEDKIIIRRPVPLFYYFHLLYAEKSSVLENLKIDFCNRLLEREEMEYIQTLVENSGQN